MGDLKKIRLDSDGNQLSEESALDKNQFRGSIMDRIKTEMDDEQGCRLSGFIKVYRVPGNFHIATHAYQDIYQMLKNQGRKFDFTYEVGHISFGNKQDFDYISQQFEDLEMEHPCDGLKGSAGKQEDGSYQSMKSMFYLVAVPSYFEKGLFKYHVY